jgi:glyoxylase-like metal-dependent hydrolase (beta-lactamase superfamily II)
MAHKLIHEILPVGMLQCNCSILGDPATREAIVIDPGDEVDRILAVIQKHNLKVRAILNTHAHIDHVGGLRKLHEATGAPVFMHRDDLELYRRLDIQAQWLGVRPPAMIEVDQFLREGDRVRWGGYEARVLHTPGHTQGSVSLYLPFEEEMLKRKTAAANEAPWLFAGDTLFAGSIGRTDLWGGSMPAILASIQEKLLALPDETIVFPGHGPTTTIGDERETNPFLV